MNSKSLIILAAAALLGGCYTPTWRSCKLYTHDKYKVMACDDTWTGQFCKSRATLTDYGKPVDYYPRACAVNLHKRKPSIVIGKYSMGCLPHEICHIEGKPPAYCADKFPCREDVK